MSELRQVVYLGSVVYLMLGIIGILLWDISVVLGIVGIILILISILQFFRIFTYEENEISDVEKRIMLIVNFIPNLIIHCIQPF